MWEDGQQQASGAGNNPAPGKPAATDASDKGKSAEGGGDKQKAAPADKVELSKKDYEAMQKRVSELEASERYWADQAKASTSKAKPDDDEEEDDWGKEPAHPTKAAAGDKSLVDELAEKGVDALFTKGIPTKAEIRTYVQKQVERGMKDATAASLELVQKQQKMLQRDAELVTEFPDLGKADSELSKRTQAMFQQMVKDEPELRKSQGALRAAAKAAAAELKTERRGSEEERLERIRRQSGDYGSRRGGFDDDENEDALSPIQRRMLDRFNSDGGVQISEDAYMARAKKGVNMSSKMAPPEPKRREVGDWQ